MNYYSGSGDALARAYYIIDGVKRVHKTRASLFQGRLTLFCMTIGLPTRDSQSHYSAAVNILQQS